MKTDENPTEPPHPDEEQASERRTLGLILSAVLGAIALIWILLFIFL